jgi:glycosyltransferase involved in cell wall biosynthesis
LKILHIIDSLGIGGKERRLLELLKAFQDIPGLENHLVSLSDKMQFDSVKGLGVPITVLPRRSRRDLSIFPKLYRFCRQYRPEAIHSWESMCSIYAAPVAKSLNIKFINAMITTGRVHKRSKKWIRAKLTFPFSDLIVSNSFAGLSAFDAPRHKSICIHNGFDFNRTSEMIPTRKLRQMYGIRAPKVIGMVATVDHRKDLDSFISAARGLLPKREDVCFVAVGGGPLLEHYRQMAAEGPAADRIHFVGPQTNVESFINFFDIGLLLTRSSFAEGISNAIMEYMAFAKPVVATLSGGTPEIVLDGRTGFLVPADDQKLLLKCLFELLDNPAVAEKMGQAGKRRIKKEFSLEQMAQKTFKLYKLCLNGKGLDANFFLKAPAPPV